MDRADGMRRWALPVVAVAAVAAVVTVAVFVVGVGVDTGCACQPENPDVQIQRTQDGTAVTVTYVASRRPRELLVRARASNGSVSLAATDGNATATDEGVRLSAVGASATFAEGDPDSTTDVTVVVDVRYDDGSRVTVVDRTVRL